MKEIKLTKNKVTIVDDSDYEYLSQWKWRCLSGRNNYAGRSTYLHNEMNKLKMKIVMMHRLIMNPPDNLVIDHIDGNGLNNQRSNLRICSIGQNSSAKRKRKLSYSSKFRGVFFKEEGRWYAAITENYKIYHIGVFKTEIEAALKWDEKCKELRGEFAVTNF